MEENKDNIEMLLDIEDYSGQSNGRMGPMLKFFTIIGIPPIIYMRFFIGWRWTPMWLFLSLYIPYVIRYALKILGDEKNRVNNYIKQIDEDHEFIEELVNIRKIHNNCVEYINGKVFMPLVIYLNTIEDTDSAQIVMSEMLKTIGPLDSVDIYIQNIEMSQLFRTRYESVKYYSDREIGENFVSLIDYNIKYTKNKSLLTRMIYVVNFSKEDLEAVEEKLYNLIENNSKKLFKYMYIPEEEEIVEIMQRDLNMTIDVKTILSKKYKKERFFKSKVLYYGDEEETKVENIKEERGFIINE